MTILEFKRPEELMFVGDARCNHCGHEWEGRAPEGTWELECPFCGSMQGMFIYEHAPSDDDIVRVCGCGGQLFWILPTGHMCAKCGQYQDYDE